MEEFRELPQYPGYRIGNQGMIIGTQGYYMTPYLGKRGYYVVTIHIDKKLKLCPIHRLIALAWIPNPENKLYIDHINRDRTDNRLCNLRWVTKTENNQNHGVCKRNTTGVVGLSYREKDKLWRIAKTINGILYQRFFKERSDAEIYLQQIVGNL